MGKVMKFPKIKDLKGKTLSECLLRIMKEEKRKKWIPAELQKHVKRRADRLYSESSVTATLRALKIPATPPTKNSGTTAWTYKFLDMKNE